MSESVAQLIDGERFQQVVVDAAGDEIPIEPDVVDGTGRNHDRAWLADLCKRVDIVERVTQLAEIDEQDVRARRDGKRLHRIAKATLVDLLRRPAMLDCDRPKHVGGCVVADERGERITQTRACLERSVH